MRTPYVSSSSTVSSTRCSESARRSSLKRVPSWIRSGSTSSSSARCARICTKTSSLVIGSPNANGGLGRAKGARGPQGCLGPLDHPLVDGPLSEADGAGDAGGGGVAVGRDGPSAQAEHDAAADLVLGQLATELAEPARQQ